MSDPTALPSAAQRLITAKLPDWIASTTAQERARMRAAGGERPAAFEAACLAHPEIARQLSQQYAEQRHAEQALHALLSQLPDLHRYASDRLQTAIKQRFGVTLDVAHSYLLNPSKAAAYKLQFDGDPLADGQRALKLATQSLLHCALQNFEAAEASPGGMDIPGIPARVLDSDEYLFITPTGNTLPIPADAFARLVRELDLGGAYQALIDKLLGAPKEDPAGAWQCLLAAERSAFRLHVHKALLDQAIEPGLHGALLQLADDQTAHYLGSPLRCALLEVSGVELTGALVIGLVPSPERLLFFDPLLLPYKRMLVTYLPGAPEPLRVHASAPLLQEWLDQQMASWPRTHRPALVAQHERARFERELAQDSGTVRLRPFSGAWADRLAEQRQQRLRDDALFHAVPTELKDRKSASKRLAYFTQLGFAALNVGAFFVPGLNTLMLGVAVVQLGVEVYEGIESWADGDREQAMSYMVDVLENLALAGVLGATANPGAVPAIEAPAVVEALVPVELPDGNPRLWQPDLRPFAHDTVLPAGLTPDAQGLYQHAGKTWLPLDGSLYALTPGPAYRLVHPRKTYGYQPPLRHNGAGAWLHPLDQPDTWHGARLLHRAVPADAVMDETLAAQILHAAGVEDSVLRRALSHGERLAAQLQDTLLRFTVDQDVRRAMPGAPRRLRMAEFARRLARQPANPMPEAALLRRVYPGVPETVLDELLRTARPDDLSALGKGRIPLRVGEELRQYRQRTRLARAYEGLYLDSVANADSDLLILHTANELPDWPRDLRVELHDSTLHPGLVDSIGPATADRHCIIRRHPNGYAVSTLYPAPGSAHLHETLYEALHDATGEPTSLDALRLRIQHAALPRKALRNLLGIQRRAFVSPMRLADGRLGYPLSPSPSPTPSPKPLTHDLGRLDRINRHLRQLEAMGIQPAIANWLLSVMAELPISHAQISERIAGLPAASAIELETSLAQWRASPGLIADDQARSYSRDMIETALWRHWVQSALAEPNELPLALYFNNTFIAEFPQHLPASFTNQVRHLHLDDVWLDHALPQNLPQAQLVAQIDNLLQHFPDLETLVIDRPYAYNSAPTPWQHALGRLAEHLPNLSELRFVNQNVAFTLQDIDRLAQPARLRYLDISGNSLETAPAQAQAGGWALGYLGLERMSLTQWPAWLEHAALERIESVSLLHNHLTSAPEFLAVNPLSDAPPTVISLEGNPLSEQQVTHLALSEDGLARRYRFNLSVDSGLGQRLRVLYQQRSELRQTLNRWVDAARPDDQALATRGAVASELNGFWEARARGLAASPLHFLNLPLEHFPTRLPAFLTQQVQHLIVEGLHGSTAQLDGLLRQFPRLVTVALYENTDSLQALPAALESLPMLNELELVNQGLLIDDEMMNRLVRLPALESLDLSDNRLSPTLRGPFPGARQLAHLSLSGTGLETWPHWLFDVMPSVTLDLGYNRLNRLPDSVLGVTLVDSGSTRVSLAENPLDEDIRQRLDNPDGEPTLHLPHGYRPPRP